MRLPPDQLARLDQWISEQPGEVARPEAVRRLLDKAMPPLRRTHSPTAPFAINDRVEHKIFGLGTVIGPIVAMAGPDMTAPGGVVDKGWSVGVAWDDPDREEGRVADWSLTRLP